MKYYQQGDCLIKPCVVSGELKKGNTLVEGEHTGHAHRVTAGDFELYEKDGTVYLKAKTECTVTHEEHHAQTVAPGEYRVDIVKEYDPYAKAIERVRD